MKKLFLIFSLTLLYFNAFSEKIDSKKAVIVATNFVKNQASISNARLSSDLELTQVFPKPTSQNARISLNNSTPYYIYNFNNNEGFIIIAGDDASLPVLGYSFEGAYIDSLLSPQFVKWIENYKKQIQYIQTNKIEPTDLIIEKWGNLISGNFNNNNSRLQAVAPLIKTKWNQPEPYNNKCPRKYFWSERAVTGCVATAMAQIMKFWNHPSKGSGFNSYSDPIYGTLSSNFSSTYYDWASMPNQINSSSSSVQKDAISTLMYDCGISVNMNYNLSSNGGSSAYLIESASPITNCSEFSLKKYFGYKNSLKGIQGVNYTQNEWLNILKSEFNANRPVLYAGFGNGGGHCFIADGYDNNDYIHFNWGWGGSYDGYFEINALNPSGLGTGGGSGDYNNNHQAIIGIEPAINQNINLALYSNFTVTPSTINYGQSFSVKVNLVNNGATTFNGDLAIGIFNSEGTFIDYVETKTSQSLQAGFIYTNGLTFNNTGLFSLVPGSYNIMLLYRTSGGEWSTVNNGNFVNLKSITVKGPANDLKLYDSLKVSTGSIIQNKPFNVTFNLANYGTSNFNGDITVAMYKLDGTFVSEIGNKTGITLESGYFFTNGITINSTGISTAPGSYLLVVINKANGGSAIMSGSGSTFPNPIIINVETPPILPDIYESNNNQNSAYNIPISFSSNSISKNTIGSNLHIGTDVDYYKVSLPIGYSYEISARVHDKYNSGNGQIYTADVLFSIEDDTSTTDVFDDIMPTSIKTINGGTIYFKVAPYFSGLTGSYLLDLNITRSVLTSINENSQLNSSCSLYPNPADNKIKFKTSSDFGSLSTISVLDLSGQTLIYEPNFDINQELNISDLKIGLYLIKISNGISTETLKFSIIR